MSQFALSHYQGNQDLSRPKRHRLFAFVCAALVGILAGNESTNLVDGCLIGYVLVIVFGLACNILTVVWISKSQSASDVLRWVNVLIFGSVITHSIQLYARYLFVTNDMVGYGSLIRLSLWHYRMLPILLSIAYMLCLIIARMTTTRTD